MGSIIESRLWVLLFAVVFIFGPIAVGMALDQRAKRRKR